VGKKIVTYGDYRANKTPKGTGGRPPTINGRVRQWGGGVGKEILLAIFPDMGLVLENQSWEPKDCPSVAHRGRSMATVEVKIRLAGLLHEFEGGKVTGGDKDGLMARLAYTWKAI